MFISKTKLIIAVLAMALIVPATAFATDAWPDTEDGKFYHDAVTWAKANGMTTGCDGGTNFCPDRGVTRGENITFAKRYDDLVVQPALAATNAAVDAVEADVATNTADVATNTADIADNASDIGTAPVLLWAVMDPDATINRSSGGVTAASLFTGAYEVIFPRNITNCAFTATAGVSDSVSTGDSLTTSVVGRDGNSGGVFLQVWDETGAAVDFGVHMIVACPWNQPLIIIPLAGETSIGAQDQ